MQAAGPVGIGLSVMSALTDAQGKATGYQYAAATSERKSLAAKTAADQTDATLRAQLLTTLGNISAIRAAAGVSLDSPTGLAINDANRTESERQRLIKVGNLEAQSSQYASDAQYYQFAAGTALESGYLNAFGKGLQGLSGLG